MCVLVYVFVCMFDSFGPNFWNVKRGYVGPCTGTECGRASTHFNAVLVGTVVGYPCTTMVSEPLMAGSFGGGGQELLDDKEGNQYVLL